MANGPEIPDLNWWQALGAALAAGLASFGIGRRSTRSDGELAHADTQRCIAALTEKIGDLADQVENIARTMASEGRETRRLMHEQGRLLGAAWNQLDKNVALQGQTVDRIADKVGCG